LKIAEFKYSIGDMIQTHGRNLLIIDREYRTKTKHKRGKPFTANEKYYKYRCLDCGNEDWMVEYSLGENQHCGCNACGKFPKKVVRGVNDITTTAPWMIKYFPHGEDEASLYFKFDKRKIEFVCPDCDRVHTSSAMNVYANHGLSCVCSDKISYPNKYIFSFLEQLNIDFDREATFEWSPHRFYDFYIPSRSLIIEAHGNQHYGKPIIKSYSRYRTTEEEMSNDLYKQSLADNNGIQHYFQIDCRESNSDYIQHSIIASGLLEVLDVDKDTIDWGKCDEFATKNLIKEICEYQRNNPSKSLKEISRLYKIAYARIFDYIKKGNKYGWCNYTFSNDANQSIA